MSLRNSIFIRWWGRGLFIATVLFTVCSLLIYELADHNTPRKDVFYSWLLVFFNAYIGTFIANQAIKRDFTGFMVWALLVNGLRAGIFLMLLLSVVDRYIYEERVFVLVTFFGYFSFLAAEIIGFHKHTQRVAKDQQCDRKDD